MFAPSHRPRDAVDLLAAAPLWLHAGPSRDGITIASAFGMTSQVNSASLCPSIPTTTFVHNGTRAPIHSLGRRTWCGAPYLFGGRPLGTILVDERPGQQRRAWLESAVI
ncbi:hypothetical protein [Xylella fastidiosa]|uniref:hypothetical protein n=1 Tax=Xylella fastidiosa TaxID=2371 RepID=UPI0003D394C6|nr:hypothetical protein [Xylella fastidiosa]ALQ98025.1 hypothetical protein XFC3_12340 [Xylella fastidiosa]ALR09769.2 hypothetical protein XFFB_11895 [Xylella fastidiosa]ETE28961.1 hypothetical protein B398_12380 [Xylella fastidiosa 32]WGZ34322.1 hypothetical protein O4445_11980 [Xylella fastidiosa subsp. pauca]WGZ36611.1 hypothetical protein O4443_11800 [Xylella fastidiosa subsp. pauca]